jgi:hypothetical protein
LSRKLNQTINQIVRKQNIQINTTKLVKASGCRRSAVLLTRKAIFSVPLHPKRLAQFLTFNTDDRRSLGGEGDEGTKSFFGAASVGTVGEGDQFTLSRPKPSGKELFSPYKEKVNLAPNVAGVS